MGQRQSSWRRKGGHRPSYAFAAPPSSAGAVDLIDLNSATEELLMTLPGVDRKTAQSIVEHRRAIGRFRKVEDAALAPGMGAERLCKIRADVRVADSPAPHPVDVNAADVFRLQRVRGLDQRLAANIVQRRRDKGRFPSLDALLKVKGMTRARLRRLEGRLYAGGGEPDETLQNLINRSDEKSMLIALRDETRPPSPLSVPFRAADDVLDLLSACSARPFVLEPFSGRRDGRPAVRVASWNLDRFGAEKASNPGVREVLCMTLLENRWSILGIQDVSDRESLRIVRDELNAPSLRRVREWKDNSRRWNCVLIEGRARGKYLGFVYDASAAAEGDRESARHASDDFDFGRVDFEVGAKTLSVLNVRLPETNTDYGYVALCDKIEKLSALKDRLVVVGDFRSSDYVKDLAACYRSVTETDADLLAEVDGDTSRRDCGTGMFVENDNADYTGRSGVVDAGLRHMAIPHGWTWGGPVSPYRPVWAEFYVD